jgi:hypothetical protein
MNTRLPRDNQGRTGFPNKKRCDATGVAIPYFAPYIGVGVGYHWSHLSGFTASAASGFPRVASDDTYGTIAYQFILGGAVPIPSVRGLAMTGVVQVRVTREAGLTLAERMMAR